MTIFRLSLLFILLSHTVWSQDQYSISGKVEDTQGSSLPGVNIYISSLKRGTVTDMHGNYTLADIPKGKFTITVSAIGFHKVKKTIDLVADRKAYNFIMTEDVQSLSEVVISASRTPESRDELATTVTILSRDVIEEQMKITSNISDIMTSKVPGLAPSTGTSSNFGQKLRGRNFVVMIDGVSQSTPLRNGQLDIRSLDPSIIERVEVIKGASAIYGNGAEGGIINYITKKNYGDKPFSGSTDLSATGSLANINNTAGARLNQNFYGKAGKWSYLVNGTFEQTGEFKDAEGDVLPPTYGLGETNSLSVFAKIGYAISDSQKLVLSYNRYTTKQNTNYVQVDGDYDTRQKSTAEPGTPPGVPQGTKNNNLHLTYDHQGIYGNTSLNADVYYQDVENTFFWSDVFEFGGQSQIYSEKKGARFVLNTPHIFSENASVSATYGVDLLNDVTSQPLVDGRIWVPEMDMVNFAPFAQLKFSLLQNLILKGGIRVERITVKVDDYTTLRTVNPVTGEIDNPGIDVKGGKLDYTATVFNAGIRYNKYRWLSPYFSFSQGFSIYDIGSILRAARVTDMKDINTEASIVNNYELGLVSKFNKFRIEAVGFISTSKLGSSGEFKEGVFNILRSPERLHGFEGTVEYRPFHNLNIGGTYSYLEGKRDVNDDGDFSDDEDVYLGGDRIAAPKTTAYVKYAPIEKLNIYTELVHIGDRDRFSLNENGTYDVYQGPVEAYNIVNLSIGYQLTGSTAVHIAVENLFNEDYFPTRSQWFTRENLYTKGKGSNFRLGLTVNF
ncbi:TonB-dependent receptor [Sinomicrobium weinanense]|uniref:TonB-dependent receptor n=1 Tax=Sinomicrobium weinanense TaxID=2842200 RepID=A0A926JTP3_9FLAO|nr:TonB-dependent receptor [Sinomicrobium weinanense]MBC9797052.1 TonB-dependent receptor [Sinomicrobium weinanense]MBU3122047.1 TonB-dependent receptor [Sinomicrobium weinanense]